METKRTACNRDCPDACEILATVEDGRITRLRGAPDHPVTQGFLCHRTSRFLDRQYSSDRLLTPLIRQDDELRPAGWEQAFDLIADSMLRYRNESGAASIMHYRCGGSMGIMKHVSDWFFQKFGPVTTKSGDICSGAGEAAQLRDFGRCDSNDIFDIDHSRTIILWGKNLFVSSVHLIPIVKRARANGAKVILIDPIRHRTKQLADVYVQPRPGTDAAIALGIARRLFDQSQFDEAAANYCDHFDSYRKLAESKTCEEWATIADITLAQLLELAKTYANGPSAILIGWGMQRRRYGAATVRTIDALAAMSGNLGIPGGGASFYFQRRGAFDFSFSDGAPAARTIPEPLLGPGIREASDPPIRMVWVTAANPVAMLPESETVKQALAERELTVVVDPFLTDTAQVADVVLPTTTFLEEDDLVGAYGHHWIAEMRPVVEPPPGVLSDYQIVQALAPRVGLEKAFCESETTWKQRLLKKVQPHGITLDRLAEGAAKNPFVGNVAFDNRQFDTASGRVNLIHTLPETMLECSSPDLRLSAVSTIDAQSSQWPPALQEGRAQATIHPSAAPGAVDGQTATLKSSRGTLEVELRLDETQRTDMIIMEKGGWLSKGRCANSLVDAELTDDGECAVYYDTLIQIEPK